VYRSAILESELKFANQEITIHCNVVSMDFLKGERNRLLDYFKTYYQNESINVLFAETKPDPDQHNQFVLSTREIFDAMASKNQNLRILKDSLGMDIEY
jgi:hypothetical protein